jgi:hypothetical protein
VPSRGHPGPRAIGRPNARGLTPAAPATLHGLAKPTANAFLKGG